MMLITSLTAEAAWAGCAVSADQGARVRAVDPTNSADADLIVSMSLVPRLTHLDYAAAAQRPACDLGSFDAGGQSYELWGEDAPRRRRTASPTTLGQPIATVVPVFNMVAAVAAMKAGKAIPTEGYLLATVTPVDLTGWRFYTAMPDAALLKRDMREALSGGGTPIFRNGADGRTSIFAADGDKAGPIERGGGAR